MTVGEKYRELLNIRKEIEEVDWDNDPTIQEMISVLTKDINKTINFIKNDCTAEEFTYLSEIFEEIMEKTRSKEFIDCLYEVSKKYPKEVEEYNVISFIDDAAEYLDD